MTVLFMLLSSVMAGAMGFVLDVGVLWATARRYQNVADAAALAAAQAYIVGDDEEAEAEDYAALNDFDGSLAVDENYTPCGGVKCIKVTAQKNVPKFFIQLVYDGAWYARKSAVATVTTGPSPYALMALNQSACSSFSLNGTTTVSVSGGGGSYTRSSCATALNLTGNAVLNTGVNDVYGGWTKNSNASWTPEPTSQVWLPDPFANLAAPGTSGLPCWTGDYTFTGNQSVILSPDYAYCQELRVSANAGVTLIPGTYILRAGMQITGNGSVNVQNNGEVLLYNTCASSPCNGATPGSIDIAGNGAVSLRGLSSNHNIMVWVDRTASSAGGLKICGHASGSQTGIIYAPSQTLKVCGNGTVTWQAIVDQIVNDGNANLTINYDQNMVAPSYHVSLTQ
jgi:Flp pilus assembly protein TadG